MASASATDQEEVFLVDGKQVIDDDGNVIKTKSAYKKFVKLQKIKEKKAGNQAAQQQQKAANKQAPKKKKEVSIYTKTVLLPETSFDLRANAPKREPEIQALWKEKGTYRKLIEKADATGAERFTLHDGPPYANGSLHMGHALNKVLKDIINKYKMQRGKKVEFIPGWDTHGLPIELKVLQSLSQEKKRSLKPMELRKMAREFALETVEAQKASFERYGVWGSFDEPYVTLAPEYEAAQVKVFGQMVAGGHIYRGRKPVYWSPSSQTALAEAELEYPEGHTSPSIYVGMKATKLTPCLEEFADQGVSLAIWTTTPWTIPANRAISVNPALSYSVVKRGTGDLVVVATDLVAELESKFGDKLEVLKSFTGEDLSGTMYQHPLVARENPVVIGGDYITTEAGTGLVHTAPGHGMDDYITGMKNDLDVFAPVDDKGCFTSEAGEFEGLEVLGEGNVAVRKRLEEGGVLILYEPYVHKYPYDWRTKKPCLMRATSQWFCSVDGFRDQALDAISSVQWIPAVGENRIRGMVEGRSDWCISRQRTWGVPIPVFYDEKTGDEVLDQEVINHVAGIFAEKGSNAWWEMSVEELMPAKYADDGKTYVKGMDTMDVWFDSGSSWASVMQQRGLPVPVDLYLEGSDQSRGWFQSSLLTSVAATGKPPYKTVLTHGFVLDEKGYKMSKSLGNVVDPAVIINGGPNLKQEPAYGADTLRLWASSVNYNADVLIGNAVLGQASNNYRKIRGTLRFLIGNLFDFDEKTHAVPTEKLPALDRYMLARSEEVFKTMTDAYEAYNFSKVFSELQTFCVKEMSTFYLDIAKDRLYISAADDERRRSCQTVLHYVAHNMVRVMAPIVSHMAEDAWQAMRKDTDVESVFEMGWVSAADVTPAEDPALWAQILEVCDVVNMALEQARTANLIGSSLEAKITLHVTDAALKAKLESMAATDNGVDDLKYLFITSQAVISDTPVSGEYTSSSETATVLVERADGEKCERCWNYCTSVGSIAEHPTICDRCGGVLARSA
uniref:isoleucine--tRNA ligase n=1 Tax=Eutreptiella gymnastica TaxID=73025 RepID=A0A7S1JBQ1_9EUGL